MTKWSVFSLSQIPDQARRVAAFDADLGLFELAEQLGYDKVWIAEHLFSTYGVVTSTQVYAAAIAERTKRIRIGTAVVVVPFNHPLRTATCSRTAGSISARAAPTSRTSSPVSACRWSRAARCSTKAWTSSSRRGRRTG